LRENIIIIIQDDSKINVIVKEIVGEIIWGRKGKRTIV
jgi:hypothetical protein